LFVLLRFVFEINYFFSPTSTACMVSVWTLVRTVLNPGMVAGLRGTVSGPAALAPVVAGFVSAGENVTTQSKAEPGFVLTSNFRYFTG